MAMTLITTNTSSGAATSDFTSSIDSTYKLYIFKFIDFNPATDEADLAFNGSIDGGSNYNVTKTTTWFRAKHGEASEAEVGVIYSGGADMAQGTGYQDIMDQVGNGADESGAGELFLFNPSNTTYVKHFYSRTSYYGPTNYSFDGFMGGYFNTTDNIDAIQFKASSGNMDAVIKLYGVG